MVMVEALRQRLERLDELSAAFGRLSFAVASKDLDEWRREVRQWLELQGAQEPVEALRQAGGPKTVALSDFQTLAELAERYRRILSSYIDVLAAAQDSAAANAAAPSVHSPGLSEGKYALVMKGGGVKGLALAAAAEVLENHYTFATFAGTSAGAIAAGLMAAGYKARELREILSKKDLREFLDRPFYRRVVNLLTSRWLNSGYPVQQWVGTLLDQRIPREADVRMSDLPNRAVIYAANERDGTVTFDSADPADAKESVDVAVRCSMAIPFFFAPVHHRGQETFDGGIGNNFPLAEFLTRYEGPFVGLYLTSGRKAHWQPKSRLAKILNLVIGRDERVAVDQHRDSIVLIDPTPVRTTQFSLSNVEKDLLLSAGRAAALRFLSQAKPGSVSADEVTRAHSEEARLRADVTRRYQLRRSLKLAATVVVAGTITAMTCWRPRPPPPLSSLCAAGRINGHPASDISRRSDHHLKVDDVHLMVAADCRTSLSIHSTALENFRLEVGGAVPAGGLGPWLKFVFKDREGRIVKSMGADDSVLSAGVEQCGKDTTRVRELGLGARRAELSVAEVKRIAAFEWEFASEWQPQLCK